ncbi:ImmA/IrrE family metallo-endopeptidase [Bacillus sp. D-CC]
MTQASFTLQKEWVEYVYGVPNTVYGRRTRNSCNFIIRFRFRDQQNSSVMHEHGPIVPQGENFPVRIDGTFADLPDWAQAGLTRPNGPGPFGTTNENDIAVYYINGPLALVDNQNNFIRFFDGFAPIITPDGPAIIMSNSNVDPGTGLILAHELGHVLLGNGGHVNDDTNLMNETVTEGRSIQLFRVRLPYTVLGTP